VVQQHQLRLAGFEWVFSNEKIGLMGILITRYLVCCSYIIQSYHSAQIHGETSVRRTLSTLV
jgi:hypothetical protein